MNFLLDTCVVSELVKPKPDAAVVDWIRRQAEEHLYLSVLTLGELEKGIAKQQDPRRAEKLRHWVDGDLHRRFDGRLLDVTAGVACQWGRLQGSAEQKGRRMPVVDGLIAATALHFGCHVVTRNTDDLTPSGVEILNPWLP